MGEQGIGDVILHSQYIHMFQDEFSNLSLAVEKLMSFFKIIYPNVKVIDIEKIKQYNDYDYHLPIGSLGKNFQKLLIFQNYVNNLNMNFTMKEFLK